jgi:hypothetical protein
VTMMVMRVFKTKTSAWMSRGKITARLRAMKMTRRSREIEEDNYHDELDEDNVIHYYVEIHDMVTRFVLWTSTTLVQASMLDAAKNVLSFLLM